jgi:hypothetical protein
MPSIESIRQDDTSHLVGDLRRDARLKALLHLVGRALVFRISGS